jgi:hypothetical protein
MKRFIEESFPVKQALEMKKKQILRRQSWQRPYFHSNRLPL